MRVRVVLARFIVRLGQFVQSLALMVMRPDDLVEYSRKTYAKSKSIEGWGRDDILTKGLSADETVLFEKIPRKKGKILLLGVGGGREAISFGKSGFEVTGADFVPEMVTAAQKNAAKYGVKIDGIEQEISRLDVPAAIYDVVWLSASMYSCIPTRQRRINMLKRISKALTLDGCFVCQFHWDPVRKVSPSAAFARKIIAVLTLGNIWYEKGDQLWGNAEFIHAFSQKEVLKSEFKAGGFEIVHIHIAEGDMTGGAVLKPIT